MLASAAPEALRMSAMFTEKLEAAGKLILASMPLLKKFPKVVEKLAKKRSYDHIFAHACRAAWTSINFSENTRRPAAARRDPKSQTRAQVREPQEHHPRLPRAELVVRRLQQHGGEGPRVQEVGDGGRPRVGARGGPPRGRVREGALDA